MKKTRLLHYEKDALVELVEELLAKVKRKNAELHKAKTKLRTTRIRLNKMKDTVAYQRKRILELYQ